MNRKFIALAVTILIAAAVITTALATPAVGTIATLFARGTFVEPVFVSSDGIVLITDKTTDHAVQTITFPPGSSSGWHTHPGVVLVTVKSGTLTRYHSDCSPEALSAGDSFWETTGFGGLLGGASGAGLVRNEGTEPVVVYVSYILPTGAPLRLDAPNPGCPID